MRTLAIGVLLACAAWAASGVNFSGKWVIESAGGRGGQMRQTVLVLNHVGGEVEGTIGARGNAGSGAPTSGTEILDGKVEGDTISFYVWGGRSDRPSKTFYEGTMSGDEITFTVTGSGSGFGGRGQSGPQEMTAKRSM